MNNIGAKCECRQKRVACHTIRRAGSAAVFIIFLAACQPGNKTEDKSRIQKGQKTPATRADSINPNGTSELAALMRRLADFAETNRRLLESQQVPEAWPDDVNNLLTAEATDAEIKGPHYDAFAHDFIAAARRFNETVANPTESRLRHNALVGACVSCHEQACAGPLVRIKKLLVN